MTRLVGSFRIGDESKISHYFLIIIDIALRMYN